METCVSKLGGKGVLSSKMRPTQRAADLVVRAALEPPSR
jgi:hypothetical protein